jgi:hypothetical protein
MGTLGGEPKQYQCLPFMRICKIRIQRARPSNYKMTPWGKKPQVYINWKIWCIGTSCENGVSNSAGRVVSALPNHQAMPRSTSKYEITVDILTDHFFMCIMEHKLYPVKNM